MAELKLGTKVSKYLKLKKELAVFNKEHKLVEDKMKVKVNALELDIIAGLKKDKLERMDVKTGAVIFSSQAMPTIKDVDKFHKYVIKNKAWFLMGKQVLGAPYRELLEDGKKVDGVEHFNKETLNVSNKKGI